MTASASRRLPLIGAMRRDLARRGALSPATATAMWVAYGAHALFTARALTRPRARLPIPVGPAGAVGVALTSAGLAACLAGMGRFAGPSELTGTRNQALTTTGIYAFSRNPQYVGYVAALAGAAVARRSSTALVCACAMGVAYATWVPVEESHLRALYGRTYLDYQHQTHRWWGRRTGKHGGSIPVRAVRWWPGAAPL